MSEPSEPSEPRKSLPGEKKDDEVSSYRLNFRGKTLRDSRKELLAEGGNFGLPKYLVIWGAEDGDLDIVKDNWYSNMDFQDPDLEYSTALMMAARNNHAHIVKLLLDNGANFSLKDKKGKTALMIAEEKRYKNIVDLIKEKINWRPPRPWEQKNDVSESSPASASPSSSPASSPHSEKNARGKHIRRKKQSKKKKRGSRQSNGKGHNRKTKRKKRGKGKRGKRGKR